MRPVLASQSSDGEAVHCQIFSSYIGFVPFPADSLIWHHAKSRPLQTPEMSAGLSQTSANRHSVFPRLMVRATL